MFVDSMQGGEQNLDVSPFQNMSIHVDMHMTCAIHDLQSYTSSRNELHGMSFAKVSFTNLFNK